MNQLIENTNLLLQAIQKNDVQEVKRLIPVSALRVGGNLVLKHAVSLSRYEIVQLLLPHSDPKHRGSETLAFAVKRKDDLMIDLLYPVSVPQHALEVLQRTEPPSVWGVLEMRIKAEHEKHLLTQATAAVRPSRSQRKV